MKTILTKLVLDIVFFLIAFAFISGELRSLAHATLNTVYSSVLAFFITYVLSGVTSAIATNLTTPRVTRR